MSLRNSGTIVEQFTVLTLGEAMEWTAAEPPVVSLFPGAQETVTLRFSPPRLPTTPSGEVPFAVKVIPSNEPEESVTEEGVIVVGSFNDVGAELVPRVTTGRITGRQRLAVDSRGNVPLPVEVSAIDAADALKFRIRPRQLTTAPGEARFVRLGVKPRQRFWKGPQQQKPYKVQVAAENEKPLVLDGALTQKAVLPKWVYTAALIAAALVLLWFFVLKPAVHSTAVNANKAALAAQAAQTKALQSQLAATQSTVAANSRPAMRQRRRRGRPRQEAARDHHDQHQHHHDHHDDDRHAGQTPSWSRPKPTTTHHRGDHPDDPAAAGHRSQRRPHRGDRRSPVPRATNSITIGPQSTLADHRHRHPECVRPRPGGPAVQRLAAGAGQTPENLLVENLGSLNRSGVHLRHPDRVHLRTAAHPVRRLPG